MPVDHSALVRSYVALDGLACDVLGNALLGGPARDGVPPRPRRPSHGGPGPAPRPRRNRDAPASGVNRSDNLFRLPHAADTPTPELRASLLQIGEVADRIGLSLRTVRYYEEVGLLTPSARTPGGFRLYSAEDVERLALLKAMKPFGLTLEEIRELMQLLDGEHDGAGRDEVEAALRRYADRAEARVRELHAHAAEVRRLRIRIGDRLGELRDDG